MQSDESERDDKSFFGASPDLSVGTRNGNNPYEN
jgi:hypothetical protein